MAFITGLFLIDAPASALNNGEGEDTKAKVKAIRVGSRMYPYVSAQSFRYWLRTSLEKKFSEWQAAPVYTAGKGKKQQAYTEGNPITYWDDDLLGYMRAEKGNTITRVSPFRTSTLVSLSPVQITDDFGVMARFQNEDGQEGVVLHGHEFYRTVLKGLFSLDLSAAGSFTDINRTGYKNLNDDLIKQAQDQNLDYNDNLQTYRLSVQDRVARVQTLLRGLGQIEGGANQTLHYTDVAPAFMMLAVTRGGNHIFSKVVQADDNGQPFIHGDALDQALRVFGDDIVSPLYIGRTAGFMDNAVDLLAEFGLPIQHPREVLDALANDLAENPKWLD